VELKRDEVAEEEFFQTGIDQDDVKTDEEEIIQGYVQAVFQRSDDQFIGDETSGDEIPENNQKNHTDSDE